MIKKCEICEKEFYAKPSDIKRGGGKYCSPECYHKSKKTGSWINCEYCGKKFYTTKRAITRSDAGKYCSWECFKKAKNSNPNKVKVKCDYCGKEIYRWRRSIKREEHHFCSQECKSNYQKGKTGYNKGWGDIEVKCINCGRIVKVKKIRVERGIKFCSNKCKFEYQVGKNSTRYGEKNPMWKGGVTPLYLLIRKCFEYRQWRSDVFTRDNFTCQICGDDRGGNLQAHHKISFSDILNKYEITTYDEAINCEALWNINNGVTLCEKCHIDIHRNLKLYKGGEKNAKEINS